MVCSAVTWVVDLYTHEALHALWLEYEEVTRPASPVEDTVYSLWRNKLTLDEKMYEGMREISELLERQKYLQAKLDSAKW